MDLPGNIRYIIIDSHASMRDAVFSRVISSLVRRPSTDAWFTSLNELADGLVHVIQTNQTNEVHPAFAVSEMPTATTSIYNFLLINLNLTTPDSPSPLHRNGLRLYEALIARLKLQAGSIPPVLFYGHDASTDIGIDLHGPVVSCWRRLIHLARQADYLPAEVTKTLICPLLQRDRQLADCMRSAWNFWGEITNKPEALIAYVREVVQEEVEQLNHDLRHSFSDHRRPAVRILLGAVQSGEVSWANANEILAALCNTEPIEKRNRASQAINHYQKNLSILDNYWSLNRILPVPPSQSLRSYLLVDDQSTQASYQWDANQVTLKQGRSGIPLSINSEDNGWGAVLSCITRSNVDCISDAQKLDTLVRSQDDPPGGTFRDWDSVLLDYSLGQDKKRNGGYYLTWVKSRQLDLPVVIFTGADDSILSKWCLSHGASGYFVKETKEMEGRDSLKAYQNLRDTLFVLPSHSGRKRTLWQAFVGGAAQPLEKNLEELEDTIWQMYYLPAYSLPAHEMDEPPQITWNLRQSFYWLFLAERDPDNLSAMLATSRSHHEHVCAVAISIHAQNALDSLLASCWMLHTGNTGATMQHWIEERGKIGGLENAFRLAGQNPNNFMALLPVIIHQEGVAHLQDTHVTLEEATQCLANVLQIAKRVVVSRKCMWPGQLRRGTVGIKKPRNGPQPRNPDSKPLSHAKTAELGARDIVCGWTEWQCPALGADIEEFWRQDQQGALQFVQSLRESGDIKSDHAPMSLLFVDDRPYESGWAYALRILFGIAAVDVCQPGEIMNKSAADLEKYDLILLDLCMPGPEDGINVLSRVREKNAGIPVAMLTASDEAYCTHLALRLGAVNYFLKRVHKEEAQEAAIRFVQMIQGLSKQLGKASDARAVWNHCMQLKSLRCHAIPANAPLLCHLGTCPGTSDAALRSLWLNNIIWHRIEAVYASFLGAITLRFDEKKRIEIHRWMQESLYYPQYRTFGSQSPPQTLHLALMRGQLVELLSMLTIACERPHITDRKTPQWVLNGLLNHEPFQADAVGIWQARHQAAHGFLAVSGNSTASLDAQLIQSDPTKATLKVLQCAESWMRRLRFS